METEARIQEMTEAAVAEYGERVRELCWVSDSKAREAEVVRQRLLESLTEEMEVDFKGTKPHLGTLSPGCRVCGRGEWSCLFINEKCNCRCFYCPSEQNDLSVPSTNSVSFAKAGDYADYVRQFQFTGVSISGGEPLITFDRTRRYIEAVRHRGDPSLHIWMYTNGTLLTAEYLGDLKAAGLNEIRFDLSAVDYDLKKVCLAAEAIPCVTVEIPAIPEDAQRLAGMLADLKNAGVSYLNLHQLRLTPHNFPRIKSRPYTFLHGEKITVLESELTALSVLQAVRTQGIDLPINYCSFVYKHRYQRAAVRRRNARFLVKPTESVTENGYIRAYYLSGPGQRIALQAERLRDAGMAADTWSVSRDRLYFHERLWPFIDPQGCQVRVAYSEAVLSSRLSYRAAFKEVRINPHTTLYVEKMAAGPELVLDPAQAVSFRSASPAAAAAFLGELSRFEFIEEGLQAYF